MIKLLTGLSVLCFLSVAVAVPAGTQNNEWDLPSIKEIRDARRIEGLTESELKDAERIILELEGLKECTNKRKIGQNIETLGLYFRKTNSSNNIVALIEAYQAAQKICPKIRFRGF